MFRPQFLFLLACLPLASCTWVALNEPARKVLVLPAERLTPNCTSLGKVKVSVLDKVGVLARHEDEVVEDLDVLARNHAAKQDGDTVVARGPVVDGVRAYEVYRCTPAADETGTRSPENDNEVEVLPYGEGNRGS